MHEEIFYLREENKLKSEIIRILSDKQNTYHCLYTNTTDTAVPEKQTIDQDTIPKNPKKKTLIVGLTEIYQIVRQTTLLKMEIH